MDLKTAIEIADEFGEFELQDEAYAVWKDDKVISRFFSISGYKKAEDTDLVREFLWFMEQSPRAKDFPADIETIMLIIRIFEACAYELEKTQATWKKTLGRLEAEGKLAYKRKENDNEN